MLAFCDLELVCQGSSSSAHFCQLPGCFFHVACFFQEHLKKNSATARLREAELQRRADAARRIMKGSQGRLLKKLGLNSPMAFLSAKPKQNLSREVSTQNGTSGCSFNKGAPNSTLRNQGCPTGRVEVRQAGGLASSPATLPPCNSVFQPHVSRSDAIDLPSASEQQDEAMNEEVQAKRRERELMRLVFGLDDEEEEICVGRRRALSVLEPLAGDHHHFLALSQEGQSVTCGSEQQL